MKNWKTSGGALLIGAVLIVKLLKGEMWSETDYGLLAAAAGLMMAKDHNVTGGKKQQ